MAAAQPTAYALAVRILPEVGSARYVELDIQGEPVGRVAGDIRGSGDRNLNILREA